MHHIDLNCDLGEIAGPDGEILDAQLMPYVSSINVACGGHAGDTHRIRNVVERALSLNVAIGAHPGYADRENFGRVFVPLSAQEIYDLVLSQIQTVETIVRHNGGRLHHVKPHGALYNLASKCRTTSRAIAAAVMALNPPCRLVGFSGSCLTEAASAIGLRAVHECFADRNYRGDGSLVPRTQPHAMLQSPREIAMRAALIAKTGMLEAIDGTPLSLQCDTICIHSDTRDAVSIASHIRNEFMQRKIGIRPID